jgi:thiamine transporter
MNNFFAAPTDEWGDNAVKLTNTGIMIIIVAIVALIAIALIIRRVQSKEKSVGITTRQLVFSAVGIALAVVASLMKVLALPMGGSITLFSMLFIVLIAYWYGPYVGIATGIAYGLLQFVLEPIFYTIPQMIVDYPLAFGALGLAGFFCKQKHGLLIGYIVGVFGRFVFAFLSGLLFFASYAPEGMNAVVYSILYNGSYIGAEAVITIIIIALPPVSKAMAHVKIAATEV